MHSNQWWDRRRVHDTQNREVVALANTPSQHQEVSLAELCCCVIALIIVGAWIYSLFKGIGSKDPVEQGFSIGMTILLGVCVLAGVLSCCGYLCYRQGVCNNSIEDNDLLNTDENNNDYGTQNVPVV